jgi:hypothetical protein
MKLAGILTRVGWKIVHCMPSRLVGLRSGTNCRAELNNQDDTAECLSPRFVGIAALKLVLHRAALDRQSTTGRLA